MSAGYGLISADYALNSYSATFASGNEDSVWRGATDGDRRETLRAWWNGLPHQSTLQDLLSLGSSPTVVVTAGSDYVDVLRHDIAEAESDDGMHQRLAVISAGSSGVEALLPVDVANSGAIGGTVSVLNARVLALLTERVPEHAFQRREMEKVIRQLHDTRRPQPPLRASVTDDEVIVAIREMRANNPDLSRTQALAALRAGEIACAQSRFKTLWLATHDVTANAS